MSRETINEARIWCDGCGLTYLEVLNSVEVDALEGDRGPDAGLVNAVTVESILDAMQRCGWVSRERNGGRQDLCPTCRPDSPFEAVERVRKVCDMDAGQLWINGKVGSRIVAVPKILQALEGDSDD